MMGYYIDDRLSQNLTELSILSSYSPLLIINAILKHAPNRSKSYPNDMNKNCSEELPDMTRMT